MRIEVKSVWADGSKVFFREADKLESARRIAIREASRIFKGSPIVGFVVERCGSSVFETRKMA